MSGPCNELLVEEPSCHVDVMNVLALLVNFTSTLLLDCLPIVAKRIFVIFSREQIWEPSVPAALRQALHGNP